MGWGKIEVTVSFIQVGLFPIYDSRDMSLQRKSLLFWFSNQKNILSFFKSVEMVRVAEKHKMFPRNGRRTIQAGCLASWITQTMRLLHWASLQSPSEFEILHFFERSSFLPNNLVLLQCLSILVWVYKGERNPTASWVIFLQCWLLKDCVLGTDAFICCWFFLGTLDKFAVMDHFCSRTSLPFLFSILPFCSVVSFLLETQITAWAALMLPHGRNAASSLCTCIPASLIHSSSRVILLDSSSGALWERQHSDLQGSLKNSVKMSAVIGFWIRAPAVCVDSSIFSLFSSVSTMEVTLGSFLVLPACVFNTAPVVCKWCKENAVSVPHISHLMACQIYQILIAKPSNLMLLIFENVKILVKPVD